MGQHFVSKSRVAALVSAVLSVCSGSVMAEVEGDDGSRVEHRLGTIEPRVLLRDSGGRGGMRSGRFTGLDQPLDRAARAATEDRLSWGRSSVSYYPLDTGLWAGVPSSSLAGVRGGIGAGSVVDIRYSMGRPAGASGDPDVRSMWYGNATGVDHDALGRAVYGGTASPLEATNLRQRDRATRHGTTVSTAAMSRNASLPVSMAQYALPLRGAAVRVRGGIGATLPMEQAGPAADSMEHPEYRRARLRGIAARAMERAETQKAE